MKKCDEVRLNIDDERLTKLGIYKGYEGTIIEKTSLGKFLIWFSNPKNKGEFAFIEVEEDKLDFVGDNIYPEQIIQEMEEFVEKVDLKKYTKLTKVTIKEYDKVKLLVDKSKYLQEGVKKGTYGCVLYSYAIKNKIAVLFYNVGEAQEEIELMVDLEDIIVVE